jgi:hypothetical protein
MLNASASMSTSAKYAYLVDEIAFFQLSKFGIAKIQSTASPNLFGKGVLTPNAN